MEPNNNDLGNIVDDSINDIPEPLKANNPIGKLKEEAGRVSDYGITLISLGIAGGIGTGIIGIGIKTDEPIYYALGSLTIGVTAATGYLYHRLVGRNQSGSQ